MSSEPPDPSLPLPTGPPHTPWGALASTLKSNGILRSNADAKVPSKCVSCADMFGSAGASTQACTAADSGTSSSAAPLAPPLLLVLVSGSWCAPCRNFTPVLASCNDVIIKQGIKVVLCSADADTDAFTAYYGKMPSNWCALPFEEDGEDDRDDLMEALGADSLPCLLVFDPIRGSLIDGNAVHAVQAGGPDGFEALVRRWRDMASAGETASAAANGATNGATNGTTGNTADKEKEEEEEPSQELKYFIPAPTALICQYFRERLLSPSLPEALSTVVLHREVADADPSAVSLSETLRETRGPGERWLFRTAAPALPVNSYGSSLGFQANAIECWEIERSPDNQEDRNIARAVVNIENETGRLILIFRERIVMERTEDGAGTNVTKTLNLDGVPGLAHGPFRRRWEKESELIFHALLGTCDRRKAKKAKSDGGEK